MWIEHQANAISAHWLLFFFFQKTIKYPTEFTSLLFYSWERHSLFYLFIPILYAVIVFWHSYLGKMFKWKKKNKRQLFDWTIELRITGIYGFRYNRRPRYLRPAGPALTVRHALFNWDCSQSTYFSQLPVSRDTTSLSTSVVSSARGYGPKSNRRQFHTSRTSYWQSVIN